MAATYPKLSTKPLGFIVIAQQCAKLTVASAIIMAFSGCLNQDFERQSVARYQATRASTFVGFDPVAENQVAAQKTSVRRLPQKGMSFPAGRFTGPRGRFTFPSGKRFTFPSNGAMTFPSGGMSFPAGRGNSFPQGDFQAGRMTIPADLANGNRFTWPRAADRGGFTQPDGRMTIPANNSKRYSIPSNG